MVAAAGGIVFAMVYLGLMFGFFLALRREHSAWWIVGVIALTKMCDTRRLLHRPGDRQAQAHPLAQPRQDLGGPDGRAGGVDRPRRRVSRP